MWVNYLTHTLTHTSKRNNGQKRTGQEGLASCPVFSSLSYMTRSIKSPIVRAASSCFCRVAWV